MSDGNRGGYKLLKLAPPTKLTLKNVCAKLEKQCKSWPECASASDKLTKGEAPIPVGGAWETMMLRIMDNKLYTDWPWGKVRKPWVDVAQFDMILKTVKVRDSVFFFGGEGSKIPFDVPVPGFSFASKMHCADFTLPWPEGIWKEWTLYRNAVRAGNNFSDAFYTSHHGAWESRIPKCAYFATAMRHRRVVFDQAVLRPDLLEVHGTFVPSVSPWNPLSDEPPALSEGEDIFDDKLLLLFSVDLSFPICKLFFNLCICSSVVLREECQEKRDAQAGPPRLPWLQPVRPAHHGGEAPAVRAAQVQVPAGHGGLAGHHWAAGPVSRSLWCGDSALR